MAIEDANALQDRLEAEGREHWPLPSEVAVHRRIVEWRAFRETDVALLREFCDWRRGEHAGRSYIADPLPERIAEAFSDLIFGGEPEFQVPTTEEQSTDDQGRTLTVTKPGPDQELLDDIVDDNDLPSELQDAASRCVGEGEAWWRIYVDRDAFEHPVIEWHSRDAVVPLWRGKRLLAVAFVSALDDLAPDAPVVRVGDDADPPGTTMWREGGAVTRQAGGDDKPVFRYVEIQTGGLTRNLLFRGERDKLGERVALTDRAETADLSDEWLHGLEVRTRAGMPVDVMLAGRVTNGGRGGRLGRSQYAGVRALLYELNKLQSVGSRNVDITMHKRAVVGSEFAEPDRSVDDDEGAPRGRAKANLPDVFIAPLDSMGEGEQYKVLEFSDAWADALLAWDGGLTDKILTRCRVAPQLVGRHTEDAATGPALRARLLDSVLAADGKARAWDDALPKLLRAVQMVDALPEEQGGCGHDWQAPEEPPTIVRSSVLPEDETEEITRDVAAVGARLKSRRTSIEERNPQWDEERVQTELDRIDEDDPAPAVGPPGGIRVERPPITLGGGNGAVEQLPGQVPPGGTPPGRQA